MLDAAVALFYEQGPANTTLEAVAARAGLTKGAIYSSFENKDALFAAAVERLPTTMFRELLPTGTSQSTIRRDLRRFGRAAAQLQPPDPAIALIHELYAQALRNDAAKATVSQWIARMIMDAASNSPPRPPLRVPAREAWVIGQALLEGLVLRRAINPELVDENTIATAMELLAGLVDA